MLVFFAPESGASFLHEEKVETESGEDNDPHALDPWGVALPSYQMLCRGLKQPPSLPRPYLSPPDFKAYLRCVCATLNFDVGEIWSWRSEDHDSGSAEGEERNLEDTFPFG